VTSGDDTEQPQNYLTVNVCDDGCGISQQTLARLSAGPLLVSTKGRAGAGLGLHSVVECIGRMRGRVRLASATSDTRDCPAGTIVSLCLAKVGCPVQQANAFDIVTDYGEYRSRIQSHLKEKHS
jgi:signal transduction histidine kinase